MGFGKWILGGVAAVGAVVAAPIVLPSLAATAVGGAIVSGTAAVTTAAAGAAATASAAAATVATAAASTAVGTAAVGAMSTVGASVGAAAGAVGLTSVATVTGTSAGAAAVGTIATSAAVGAASATSGAVKIKKASDIAHEATMEADVARDKFDLVEKDTNDSLENLGKLKINIWKDFNRFKEAVEKIHNLEEWEKLIVDSNFELDKFELNSVTVLALSAKEVFQGGALSLTAGQLAGLATSSGLTGIASASTGTSIASLHGVAATNASLAALGGGSLASGGLGMAGGAIVSSALAAAPALAVGGLFINSKGKKSLKNAENARDEADKYIKNLHTAEGELIKLEKLSSKMQYSLNNLKVKYNEHIDWLENLVINKNDFKKFTEDEINRFLLLGQLVSILKDLTLTQLINEKEGKQVVEEEEVSKKIYRADQKYNDLEKKIV